MDKNIRISGLITSSQKDEQKLIVLKTLSVGNNDLLNEWLKKLEDYIYIESIDEIKCSHFVRYIDRRKEIPVLARGGFVKGIEYESNSLLLYFPPRLLWRINLRFVEIFVKKTKQDTLLEIFKNFLSKENS